MGQFFKVHVLADNVHKLFCVYGGFLRFRKLRLYSGNTLFQFLLFGFVVCRKLCETLVRNASAYAVLIQPLENGGKLTDTLFSGFQLLFLGGVPAFVAVLVLLDQQLHKPGFMLCRIARHFSQIGENARSQKVGADKMSGAVMGTLLVIPTDIAVLFPLISLVTLLIHDAAAVCAKEHTREQAHFIITVRTLALFA